MRQNSIPLLEVRDLKTFFFTRRGIVKAVDGVGFSVEAGQTFGLVGESGCGKTMTALSILRVIPEHGCRIVNGQVLFEGEDLLKKSEDEMRRLRGRKISMILQDPMMSLDPVFTIGDQLAGAIRVHQKTGGRLLWEKAKEIMRMVQIPSPDVRLRHYPHQMSGGMRQRVVGAIGLASQPKLLIADEPTTSLDATIQAQYLRLLKEIQRQLGLAIIFITHDFGTVAKMCDRVAVMYAGKVVEVATVRELFNKPTHPYTVALLRCRPKVGQRSTRLATIEGQPPSLLNAPTGCRFRPRCDQVGKNCRDEEPSLIPVAADHLVSCWNGAG